MENITAAIIGHSDIAKLNMTSEVLEERRPMCSCASSNCPCMVAALVICTLVTVATVTVNSMSLCVFLTSKDLRKLHINCFMASLSLADLGMGVFVQAPETYMILTNSAQMNDWLSTNVGTLHVKLLSISIYSVTTAHIIRVILVKLPLRYEELVTYERCYAAVALVWIVHAVTYVIETQYVQHDIDQYYFSTRIRISSDASRIGVVVITVFVMVIPVSILFICNGIVYQVVRSKVHPGSGVTSHPVQGSFRAAKKISMLCGLCIFSYATLLSCKMFKFQSAWVHFVLNWAHMSGSFLNNLLYIALHKCVQSAFWNACKSFGRKIKVSPLD